MRYLFIAIACLLVLPVLGQPEAAIRKAGVLSYRILPANQSTRKPKLNEALDVNYRMSVGSTDSVLNETFTENKTVQLAVNHPSFVNIFMQLTRGDRVQIMISADSFYKYTVRKALPPYLKPGDSISFFLKIYDVLDEQGLMKKQMEQDSEKAYIDSLNMHDYLQLFGNIQTTARGLNYVVTRRGNGLQPETGDSVTIKYRGYFTDGRVFDRDDDGYSYLQGLGQVIPGLDEGVALMNEGSKFKLIIPYYLAYGTNGTATIPGYTSLVFDVELIQVKRSP
jgi:FKBP-type peptidyl-prolyl cis-trans isomerase FkpA